MWHCSFKGWLNFSLEINKLSVISVIGVYNFQLWLSLKNVDQSVLFPSRAKTKQLLYSDYDTVKM